MRRADWLTPNGWERVREYMADAILRIKPDLMNYFFFFFKRNPTISSSLNKYTAACQPAEAQLRNQEGHPRLSLSLSL